MSLDWYQLKCNGDREGCQRCLSNNLECSYSESNRRKATRKPRRSRPASTVAQSSRISDNAANSPDAGQVAGNMNTDNQSYEWTELLLSEPHPVNLELQRSSNIIDAGVLDFDERPLQRAGQEHELISSGPDLEGLPATDDHFQSLSELSWLFYTPAPGEPTQTGTENQPEVYNSTDHANVDSIEISDLS